MCFFLRTWRCTFVFKSFTLRTSFTVDSLLLINFLFILHRSARFVPFDWIIAFHLIPKTKQDTLHASTHLGAHYSTVWEKTQSKLKFSMLIACPEWELRCFQSDEVCSVEFCPVRTFEEHLLISLFFRSAFRHECCSVPPAFRFTPPAVCTVWLSFLIFSLC